MPLKRRNESISEGFWRNGIFHPIRAVDDYDPEAVGETRAYAKRKKKKRNVAMGYRGSSGKPKAWSATTPAKKKNAARAHAQSGALPFFRPTRISRKKGNPEGSVRLPANWKLMPVRVNPRGEVQIGLNPSELGSGGRWAKGVSVQRNESISEGYYDKKGRFRPIRHADDYDPEAVGETRTYAKRKKRSKR
jgi:hypothetical protein